mmetsp:Transcript_44386/g.87712  ORF Transcript_44386/g.87712 Transcript_44386/m.87712 type:complete len:343 (-) Transcript_44386:543-1571(-)
MAGRERRGLQERKHIQGKCENRLFKRASLGVPILFSCPFWICVVSTLLTASAKGKETEKKLWLTHAGKERRQRNRKRERSPRPSLKLLIVFFDPRCFFPLSLPQCFNSPSTKQKILLKILPLKLEDLQRERNGNLRGLRQGSAQKGKRGHKRGPTHPRPVWFPILHVLLVFLVCVCVFVPFSLDLSLKRVPSLSVHHLCKTGAYSRPNSRFFVSLLPPRSNQTSIYPPPLLVCLSPTLSSPPLFNKRNKMPSLLQRAGVPPFHSIPPTKNHKQNRTDERRVSHLRKVVCQSGGKGGRALNEPLASLLQSFRTSIRPLKHFFFLSWARQNSYIPFPSRPCQKT